MRKDNTRRANLQVSANLHQAYFRYRPTPDIRPFNRNAAKRSATNDSNGLLGDMAVVVAPTYRRLQQVPT